MSLALAAALALDACLGEPERLWRRVPHPAVLMGRAIAHLDARYNRGTNRRAKGAALLVGLAGGSALLAALLTRLPGGQAIEVAGAAILLAHRSLVDHVRDVAAALRISAADGRASVARIVGRETADMDAPAISRAAIESAAENLSDGVVAPAFWFLLGGLPAMAAYKAVNTADSMIGHRTERHGAFGWAAARLDDALNWVPARATALAIALLRGVLGRRREIARDAGRHRSPNAGWPEAAMAHALGVALSGPRRYHGTETQDPYINPAGDPAPGPEQIEAAIDVLWQVWWALLATALAFWAI